MFGLVELLLFLLAPPMTALSYSSILSTHNKHKPSYLAFVMHYY